MGRDPSAGWAVFGGCFVIFASAFVATPYWYLFPVFLLIGSVPLVFFAARKISARVLFDFCVLRVLDEKVPLGGVARVWLSLGPKRPIKTNSAMLTFWTEEKAVDGGGSNERIYREELYKWSTAIDVPPVLTSSFDCDLRIPIPRDIPPTFVGRHNSLRSFCRVYLDLPGVPDVKIEREITVAPELIDG